MSNESYVTLAINARSTTASTYGKGIVGEGSVIVGVCYRSVKNYSRNLEDSVRLWRSLLPAEKKSRDARDHTAQNDHTFPD